MPARSSGRSYSLRRRTTASEGAFDAPSTAAPSPFHVTASYYSPLVQPPADRQSQAEEDAGAEDEGAVVGGLADGPTDTGVVHVGLSVHSGQRQSAAPRGTHSAPNVTATTIPRTSSVPSYVRDTTVIEPICTLQFCTHCCKCHLRHAQNGYGRCMKTAKQPWPDCECAGQCTVGRCAQSACRSNHMLVDLCASDLDSEPSTKPATRSQQSSHGYRHTAGVSADSHSPTPPSPPTGVRRDSDGVHVDEVVCAGPQAGATPSSAAAYHQTSTTATDCVTGSGLVAGEEVDGVAVSDQSTHTARNVKRGGKRAATNRALPWALLACLQPLASTPNVLPVIADGRCSVASVLLACGVIDDFHNTPQGRQTIDAERRRLGETMLAKWSEREWIERVPVHLRAAHFDRPGLQSSTRERRSYTLYHELLTTKRATAWLDHCVFYLASAEYNIGIFIMHDIGNDSWYCTHVGADKDSHIVLYHGPNHFECVEYAGLRRFPSDHELVKQLMQFARSTPSYPRETDIDLIALEAEGAHMSQGAPQLEPLPPTLPQANHVHQPKRAKSSTAERRSSAPTARISTPRKLSASVRRGSKPTARTPRKLSRAAPRPSEPATPNNSSGGIKQLPAVLAQVAEHGPLYERVSFHNQPQWRAANEPLWNAYRLASLTGQRSQITPILLDILMLPQRVLPKLGRSGRTARRRATAATGRRLRSEAERIRARYNCPDPNPRDVQQLPMPTDTMANTATQGAYTRPLRRAAAIATEATNRLQSADTTDADSDAETDVVEVASSQEATTDSDDEQDEPIAFLNRHINYTTSRLHPDNKAARRANYLVQCGLARKAAQVLHSTTQLADLSDAEAQETMLRLHPRAPPNADLPTLPQVAPQAVLEDDLGMRKLLIQSDNGTAPGPSGWCGNMLSILVQSDVCRTGIIALFKDIINGELPEDARQLLLASRLVALAKPNSDGYRPIAVGEMFYKLAAIVAVRRVTNQAAALLTPHQYGLGIAAGAEKIVHSLQHELTDPDKRLALLQLDITNAFNSCDRARLLRDLYALPELQPLYRIADFAYTQPSALVLSGCDGMMIESAQGVRQGDPLSALLFCVYIRDVLQQASEQTGVKVYGFFDDVSLVGTPQQLMAALSRLQQSLSAKSLQLNTSKSHFSYFHDQLTPLTSEVLSVLSANNIQLHHDWVGAVGAVVGRDDAAIRAGLHNILSGAGNYGAFLRRLQLEELPIQSAMLLLRQCMVPTMNYYLRCIAPACIEDEARQFDQRMTEAAFDKLGLDSSERSERTTTLLQRKLRDGGWSFIPAVRTSPAAFLGSLAVCHAESAFAACCGTSPLPCTSLLHRWVDDSLQRVRQAAPGDEYQADIERLLPVTADTFFSFHAEAAQSVTAKLQHTLNAKANKYTVEAAVQYLKEQARGGARWELAHHKAISAKGAWGWKVVRPEGPHLRLADVEYAIAARLNFGLSPFPAQTMTSLPEECPLCTHRRTGERVSLRDDPWHWLSCSSMTKGELTRRHDAVADAIARVALQVGGQVRREVEGLDPRSKQRPDVQIAFPGRMLLTDVVVSHSLTASQIARRQSVTASWQIRKNRKYAGVAARLGAELLNMSVDSCGGLASGASELVRAIGEEGERWSLGTWSSGSIERQLLGAVAIAVQRGNALAVLSGHTRAACASFYHERRGSVDSEAGSESVGE